MSNFADAELALSISCPGNVLLYDDKNMPSVMVKLPKQTYAQLGLGSSTDVFPAWIVNGVEKDYIYFPKFQNIVQNGRAYSLPGQDPKVYTTLDQAVSYSEAKGEGWHNMTRLEWMAVALWCKNNGFLPYGNNNYGKDSRESNYKAVPTYISGGQTYRVATGSGPLTWSHDKSPSGIWDLNGNIYEWQSGIRTVYGELQVLSKDGVHMYNDAADPDNDQSASSALWYAINGTTGALMTPNGSGTTANSLKLDWLSSKWNWITGTISGTTGANGCCFESVVVASSVCADAILKLQALGLYKYDTTSGAYESDYFYIDNSQSERAFYAGGRWNDGAYAGLFYARGVDSRGNSYGILGFRAAFMQPDT